MAVREKKPFREGTADSCITGFNHITDSPCEACSEILCHHWIWHIFPNHNHLQVVANNKMACPTINTIGLSDWGKIMKKMFSIVSLLFITWGCSYTPEKIVKYTPHDTFAGYGNTGVAPAESTKPGTMASPQSDHPDSHSLVPANIRAVEKLAVMELEAIGDVDGALVETMTNTLKDELQAAGSYSVVSREEIEAMANRLVLQQQSGNCTSDGCLADMGKALGTKLMVYGSISKIGDTFSLSLRLLDTESKLAIRRVNERCKCSEEDLFGSVQRAAVKLMR